MKNILDDLVERFEIHNDMTGFGVEVRCTGFAYRRSREDHYLVRLHSLPNMKFYLKRDSRGEGGWMIFSGMIRTNRTFRFFNPVGTAQRISSNFMKLKFTDLNLICYLRLTPKDFHYNTKVA